MVFYEQQKHRQDQYTAGLVSKPFWFYEHKAHVNELLNGSSQI